FVPEQLASAGPMSVELATSEQRKPGDFVSILDGQLKPGLEVRVSLQVDALQWQKAGPPTDVIEIGLARVEGNRPPRAPTIEDETRPLRRRRKASVVMEGRREPAGPTS